MPIERRGGGWAVWYLAAQGAAVVGWWVLLALSPRVRGWFELDDGRQDALTAFVVADLLVLAAGSIVTAVARAKGWWWSQWAVAAVAGGLAYATLYLVAWVALGGHGAAGIGPMVAATVLTTTVAVER